MSEMTDTISSPSTARSAAQAAAQVLEAVEGLHDLVDEHGAQNDRDGRIAEPVVEALFQAGAMGTVTPRELGGAEATPREAMDIYRTLAYADPSTGWVTMAIAMATGLAGAFFEKDAAAELFATPRLGIAGQGTRPGKAAPVEGGYRVSGEWQFASGIKHSTHLHTAAVDTETGQPRFFIVPVDEVDFIENWDVLGLRGTGSIDYSLTDVFVRESFSYPTLSTEPVTGGWTFRIGIGNLASINHGAWGLGVARRLLDELSAFVRDRAGRPGSLADSTSFHEQFAEAEMQLRSAHALLYSTWEEIEEKLSAGEPMGIRLETLNRAALCNVTEVMDRIAGFVFRSGGTTALRSGTLQRIYRDVHGGTQHISSSPMILQSAGRQLAGLAEGQKWVHFQLV
ncbi:acyl-CoA dehydrogenase family protein [Microbacterium pseudoresistens]|uniref:Alkylation response protein AidB-like acyl-CoA dehydrogenase n=1 Tax=Microbacterium pseudoresistens TaxID=640634 RepID=A0A7Y9EVV4_9MICO|nr:acyl-CoA dehydrogenase family protein [Microbacterium pseudoresistens]NYD54913.1 alkylation response protein AidB-like acyl-CoA dehydrogenase [Microbacterium pseudoresistens]